MRVKITGLLSKLFNELMQISVTIGLLVALVEGQRGI